MSGKNLNAPHESKVDSENQKNLVKSFLQRSKVIYTRNVSAWTFHFIIFFFFFFLSGFSFTTIHESQGKGEGISLTPHYHFHPLHRHLDLSRAITADSSPLRIASSRTRTGNLWFPSASR